MGVNRWICATTAAVLLAGVTACSSDDPSPPVTPSPTISTATPTLTPTPTMARVETPTPTASTSRPSTATTIVRLKVVGRGCDDCSFTAYTNVGGVTTKLSTQGWLYTRGGPAWKVPTSATRNMAFGFNDLTDAQTNGKSTVVVTSYQGVAPGTTLSPSQARTKTSASWCWVGTSRSTITLTVRVELIPVANPDPQTSATELFVNARLVYTSPLVGSTGTFRSTTTGGLGVTGAPRCP